MIAMRMAGERASRTFSKKFFLLMLIFIVPFPCAGQEVRISVLGLFRPTEAIVLPKDNVVLTVQSTAKADPHRLILNGELDQQRMIFHLQGEKIDAASNSEVLWMVTARDGGPAPFELEIPGKLRRSYYGKLLLRPHDDHIECVVSMDRETAVASIVAAEIDEDAPMEALKAQAVVTRSFLAAGSRHLDFDFCDTTHCQFLKSPPASASRVWSAVNSTHGLVLSYRGNTLAAMYSSRCGGKTRSLRDVGLGDPATESEAYPYFSVFCKWCHDHPLAWQLHLNQSQELPQSGDERKRIARVRQWGWSSLPGNDFTLSADTSGWKVEGHNAGHGVGMCQFGAIGMANSGLNFRQILVYYYPNTSIVNVDKAR